MLRLLFPLLLFSCALSAQSLTSATLQLRVEDPSGAAVPQATITITQPLHGFARTARTDASGQAVLSALPWNQYQLSVAASGFVTNQQALSLASNVPLRLTVRLTVGATPSRVEVTANLVEFLETATYAHNDVTQESMRKLQTHSPGSGLSDIIMLTAPGVASDSNGFFHPLGDHAQANFVIDGQPVSDQQSKQFSTQIPANALQAMEVISGTPGAEYGDKTSLIINAVTRSGVDTQGLRGSVQAGYGSFGTPSQETTLAAGNHKVGNFLAVNGMRSGRFLDTPEFRPIHAIGNNLTVFDHFDWRVSDRDTLHLNVLGARNWFQVPNTLDQPMQDQRQRVTTLNIAPSYQRAFNANTLLSVNPFVRQDRVRYLPSTSLLADTPATLGQDRHLTNWGVRADVSWLKGIHNVKIGTQMMQTRLKETFFLGITEPNFVEENEAPGLAPYDLTNGGSLFRFAGLANINQQALFAQDTIRVGDLSVTAGIRFDRYDGLASARQWQPRLAASYLIKPLGTVLRAGYARTMETPYNENLVLSSSTGSGGLASNIFGGFGAAPLQPGRRHQFNAGLQQRVGKLLVVDADYFWKRTLNAYDFGVLLTTPVQFPISWDRSKIDGLSLRVSTVEWKGLQGFFTAGHSRARFFGPSNGGLLFNSPLETAVFRIDHDQAFQQTTNIRYQLPRKQMWISGSWRYDSGLVAGAVPDLESALALTPAQQAAIGLFCGNVSATPGRGITDCAGGNWGATRLRIPAEGTADDDHNPPRITPRHLFHFSVGHDNLLGTEKHRLAAKITVVNATNRVALYNFLSTFGGTHFVTPRAVFAELGWHF